MPGGSSPGRARPAPHPASRQPEHHPVKARNARSTAAPRRPSAPPASPPFAGSMVSVTPSLPVRAPVHLVCPGLNFIPCLTRMRSKVLATSPSIVGTMRSRYSINRHLARQAGATRYPAPARYSPPPITTMMVRAPASSSKSAGRGHDLPSRPRPRRLQRHALAAGRDDDVPSSRIRCRRHRRCPTPATRPAPFSQVTLFFLNRNSTPLTLAETTSALRAMHASPDRASRLHRSRCHASFEMACVGGVEVLGRLQQRLGRDAADVQAGAAQRRALLHARHLHPQLCGADRAYIAARPADPMTMTSKLSLMCLQPQQQTARVFHAFLHPHQELTPPRFPSTMR